MYLENKNFDDIMDLIFDINEITGLNKEINKLETEPMFYEQCIYFSCDECLIFEDVKTKGCNSSCRLFEDTEFYVKNDIK